MNILLVSSTPRECGTLLNALRPSSTDEYTGSLGGHDVTLITTGIGTINTVYAMTSWLAKRSCDLAINIGICGSYNRELSLGEVVYIHEEILGDLGATDTDGHFIDLSTMGFPLFVRGGNEFGNRLRNPQRPMWLDATGWHSVRGLTVNTTAGESRQIADRKTTFKPDVESMEGGAFAYVCLRRNISYYEIRAISNYVEPRNRQSWKIDEACQNLADAVRYLLETRL
jgi:futalosine hydrolase